MKDTYRYVIHAYEDVRQKRLIKHEHGGTTILTNGAEVLQRVAMILNLEARGTHEGALGYSRRER